MNKRIFLSFLIIGALLFGFSCRSKNVVKKLVNQNANITSKSQTKKIDGVMYHLPKTVVQVTVPVKKITKTPGDFVEFVPCFFSESESQGMVKEESQSFSTDPPAFSSRGIPDTSQTYVISTKGKYFESKTLFVEYAPGNVLQKGEAESKNETLEFTVKAIATAASIAARIAPLAIGTTDEENKKLLEEFREEYDCFEKLDTNGVAGADVSKTEVIKIMERILDAQTSALPPVAPLVAPTPEVNLYINRNENRTKYQRALLTFKQIKTLEEQRNKILGSGTNTNIPPETYKTMLEKNAEAIASYRAAFLGSKSKEVWAATFEFAPEFAPGTDNAYSPLIFTYSQKYGVCNDGLLKDKSIPIGPGFEFSKPVAGADPEKCGNTTEANIKALWLKVGISTDPTKNLNLAKVMEATQNDERTDKSRGWFYRVPADADATLLKSEIPCKSLGASKYNCLPLSVIVTSANITVNHAGGGVFTKANDNEQIAVSEMQIAQLGVVASVPATTAGRTSSTAIALDPATGAMKNYKSSSTALVDKSILEDAEKAANSTIEAVDPLNKKKRELEELKTQNEINEEKKKLTNTNTNTIPDDDNRQ